MIRGVLEPRLDYIIINIHRCSRKVIGILIRFSLSLNFRVRVSKNVQILNLMNICSMFHADGHTDGQR